MTDPLQLSHVIDALPHLPELVFQQDVNSQETSTPGSFPSSPHESDTEDRGQDSYVRSLENKWIDGLDAAVAANTNAARDYILEVLICYEHNDATYYQLWDAIHEDFQTLNARHWKAIESAARSKLRGDLKEAGVFIPAATSDISVSLIAITAEEEPHVWTWKEIKVFSRNCMSRDWYSITLQDTFTEMRELDVTTQLPDNATAERC
ncbi:hypothetical protein BJ878DRAFT_137148 [Calycina marina]|uniref:Uncharacterized protein n=1 Tax=Calycina marina TaxID=1763456 RepID=A0A9P7Z0E3_9HELO|nr:hypothetical protein BJ878DRAFT_137148 [Calycina marina]